MPIRVTMLYDIHGHPAEHDDKSCRYLDDGSQVDFDKPRPCVGCGLRFPYGKDTQDPCIADLPGTWAACCGHGLPDQEINRRILLVDADGKASLGVEKKVLPNGYVELTDGRRIEFSGTVGGRRIREAVEAALNRQPLPEGFRFVD